ncbi:MAG: hypothetical protein A3F67_08655 [Verrucomicrobia bacterium RIFCSPHIGHO2_12_FULL_41_10]|nr:MAG: hypothetical protein A3F67_08655 [Verrucomicrobia bacterium RIFCSPHIGHO2_12_FULL_41_10]HLB32761.1 hypothetical protein [Chthoniobacterales bacterium]
MQFFQHKNSNFEFRNIEPWLAHEITTVLCAHDPKQATIATRLLAVPSYEDEQLCADWEEHVHPDLIVLWSSCHSIVMSDLQKMAENLSRKKNAYDLIFPSSHQEAWLRMLNIVRLSLAAEHQFCEQEMNDNSDFDLSTPRGEALAQMLVFSGMQQCLIS